MMEDTLTKNQVKLMLEHRLLELEQKIRALSGNDRKFASDKNHLKSKNFHLLNRVNWKPRRRN